MSGDYTRLTYDPRKSFSKLLLQQGRVQLDSDWNEAASMVRRRARLQALDTLGPFGIAQPTPDAFLVKLVTTPALDLTLEPGRIYVEGVLAELFDDENASYLKQPFFPDPSDLPTTGDAVVYLNLWPREVTAVKDPLLLDVALGGVDTATRIQDVWQLRVDSVPAATCGMPVGSPPSAGRLSVDAIAPPTPDDPCILPPVAGYRGLENRLYRFEIQNEGPLGTARFKWSRDNGSIVSAVSAITVAGSETTLTLDRIGRDATLRFSVDNWVTVTDDFREFALEHGDMAQIIQIDEANSTITLDRALPASGARPFGTNADELAARHTRVQRWDQNAAVNTLDSDGLMVTAAGPIDIEDGIQVQFTTDPANGSFKVADYWQAAARTADASIQKLVQAPPRGIHHRYVQLAAVSGLGGPSPIVTDCRPVTKPDSGECNCCCTVTVALGQDIQAAIDSLPAVGGCVCLKAGTHKVPATVVINRSNVKLTGESPGTFVLIAESQSVLRIGDGKTPVQDIAVSGITFVREVEADQGFVVEASSVVDLTIEHCGMHGSRAGTGGSAGMIGLALKDSARVLVSHCEFSRTESGILVVGDQSRELSFQDNILDLDVSPDVRFNFGIWAQRVRGALRVDGNAIRNIGHGVVVNDTPLGAPSSMTQGAEVVGNFIRLGSIKGSAVPLTGIDVASNDSLVGGNVVRLAPDMGGQIGIRLTGNHQQAPDNSVGPEVPFRDDPPVGIAIGYSEQNGTAPATDVAAAGNVVIGCPFGVVLSNVTGADVSGNMLEAAKASGMGIGISIDHSNGVAAHDNRVVGYTLGVASTSGVANRVSDNVLAGGSFGIVLARDIAPLVSGNRVSGMAFGAIGAILLDTRLDVLNNRVDACGFGKSGVGAISVSTILGEVRVAGNEVLDTGQPPAGPPIAPVYGIAGIWVLDTSIDGNQVTYTDALKRDPNPEDRALRLLGLSSKPTGSGTEPIGHIAQVLDNKFVGTGRTALVEMLPASSGIGFDRVMFSNNFCWHVLPTNPDPKNASIHLRGAVATVMGNHIKCPRVVPSVDFNGMQGPFIGNVASSPPINHSPDITGTWQTLNVQF